MDTRESLVNGVNHWTLRRTREHSGAKPHWPVRPPAPQKQRGGCLFAKERISLKEWHGSVGLICTMGFSVHGGSNFECTALSYLKCLYETPDQGQLTMRTFRHRSAQRILSGFPPHGSGERCNPRYGENYRPSFNHCQPTG